MLKQKFKIVSRVFHRSLLSGIGTKSTWRGRGEARTSKPEGLCQEWGSWGGGDKPPFLRVWGSAVSSPVGSGRAPAAKSFGAFWILQVSSPAVLLLDLGVIHCSFCRSARKFSGWLAGSSRKISNYCGDATGGALVRSWRDICW